MALMLSIDPGRRGCGCALFHDGQLVTAAYVANTEREDDGPLACRTMALAVKRWYLASTPVIGRDVLDDVSELALEWPTTYGGRASKGDQAVDARDLFTLAGVDGAIATVFPLARVHHCEPHAWKGSVKKPKTVDELYAIEARVLGRLDAAERSTIDWPGNKRLRWDVADGIGVGLHRLCRFARRRVIHRER